MPQPLIALILAALAPLVVPIAATHAGSPQAATRPAVIAALLGDWRGTGIVNGRKSSLTMTWDVTVADAFIRLRFRNEMAPSGAQPAYVFEGHGYYRVSGSGGAGTWMDARGLILPVRVSLTDDAFVSDWGDASSLERGRTTYRLTAPDVLEVIDEVQADDGTYREFGRGQYRRATG
jgi:hypothetical protein